MTGIDFEREGLLEGVSGAARGARLDLLEELAEDGVPLEELRRAVEQDRLALLPVERVLAGHGPRYSAKEVADRVGIEVRLLLRLRAALGVPVPSADEALLTDEDLDAAGRLKAFLDAGVPEAGIMEVSRVMGMAMAQIADANRTTIGDAFRRKGDTERDLGRRYAAVASRLLPLVGRSLEYPYRLHLREAIRHAFVDAAELESGRAPGGQLVTVGFADMVGFTRLGERLEAGEIGALSGELERIASEAANPPVRLVKTIGDAAMLVSADTGALLDAVLRMIEAAGEEEEMPPLRAGVALGEAMARGGDWYGHPVNLASRLTAFARPGTVVAGGEVKQALTEDERFAFSFVGKRRFKGLRGEIPVHRVRRGGAGGAG